MNHARARSVEQLERALRRAERRIEAEARQRLRRLRNETQAQLAVLRAHQREASRILRRLSTVARPPSHELQSAADGALRNACKVAEAMIARLRRMTSA